MKKIIFILIILLLSSCSSYFYYQVIKTTPVSNDIKVSSTGLVYEDTNCVITYNLWSEGGNIGFKFYNKTDNDIYINLEKCFFVKNGEAYNYFKNRTYTTSSSVGSTQSVGISASKSMTGFNYLDLIQTNSKSVNESVANLETSGTAVSYGEFKVICIPSKTYKYIKEYKILESTYRDCDLIRYPEHNEINSFIFTIENSPVVCSNQIEYKVGLNSSAINIENKFFISEVTNYPEDEIIQKNDEAYCDENITNPNTIYSFKNYSTNKFFIKYIKQGENKNKSYNSANDEIKKDTVVQKKVTPKIIHFVGNKELPSEFVPNDKKDDNSKFITINYPKRTTLKIDNKLIEVNPFSGFLTYGKHLISIDYKNYSLNNHLDISIKDINNTFTYDILMLERE